MADGLNSTAGIIGYSSEGKLNISTKRLATVFPVLSGLFPRPRALIATSAEAGFFIDAGSSSPAEGGTRLAGRAKIRLCGE